MFLRHVAEDAPFPHDFLDGARGVQLAELAMTSWRERRWVDVPEISLGAPDAGVTQLDPRKTGKIRMADKSRLSLNQITTANWSVAEAVEGCVRHGIRRSRFGGTRFEEAGLAACVRSVKDAGLHVSSVCRGGMFPAPTATERRKNIEDNFRAADEAAALHADSLVMVVGGCAGRRARRCAQDGGRWCCGTRSLCARARRSHRPRAAASHVCRGSFGACTRSVRR